MLHSILFLRTAVKPKMREERTVSYSLPQENVSKAAKTNKQTNKLYNMNIELKSLNGSFGIFLKPRTSPLGNKFFKCPAGGGLKFKPH